MNRHLSLLPPWHPVTRADCIDGPRPCPFTRCRHHLDREEKNQRLVAPRAHPETCALDVADRGEHTLEEVGAIMGLTRQRVEQIEKLAMAKLRGDVVPERRGPYVKGRSMMVIAAYRTLASELGRKPETDLVAARAGIDGPNAVAIVRVTLSRAHLRSALPYYEQKTRRGRRTSGWSCGAGVRGHGCGRGHGSEELKQDNSQPDVDKEIA